MSFAVNPSRLLQNMGFCEFLARVDVSRSRLRRPFSRGRAPLWILAFAGMTVWKSGMSAKLIPHYSLLSPKNYSLLPTALRRERTALMMLA